MEDSKGSNEQQLRKRMLQELSCGNKYEASQLAISFIARKKKTLGPSGVSSSVFEAARLLIDNSASADAGTLLEWFIEDGAGEGFKFHVEEGQLTGDKYCDLDRLGKLLAGLAPELASPVVEKIYGPVHLAVLKKKVTGGLAQRLEQLERSWATLFETTKNWYAAYKASLRLHDTARAAKILDLWSKDGYASERPLYFGRALLQLLSENKVKQASDLLQHSIPLVGETGEEPDGGAVSAAMAVWHLALILTQLANLEEKPRVNKNKIFGIICQRYVGILEGIDPKLTVILEKAGTAVFDVRPPPQAAGPNPMAFIQSMLAGGPPQNDVVAPPSKAKPSIDMQALLQMMDQMQALKPKYS